MSLALEMKCVTASVVQEVTDISMNELKDVRCKNKHALYVSRVALRCDVCAGVQNVLMEEVGVAKDAADKMQGEDLRHAYDAVRVANK